MRDRRDLQEHREKKDVWVVRDAQGKTEVLDLQEILDLKEQLVIKDLEDL
jgi:hypothetical protein